MTLLSRTNEEVLKRIAPDLIRPLDSVKRRAVESAMILCEGNASEAARRLGISYGGLRRLLREYRREDA